MDGRATYTIVPLKTIMSRPSDSATSADQRRESLAAVAGRASLLNQFSFELTKVARWAMLGQHSPVVKMLVVSVTATLLTRSSRTSSRTSRHSALHALLSTACIKLQHGRDLTGLCRALNHAPRAIGTLRS